MTQIKSITLTKKANGFELNGQKAKIVAHITSGKTDFLLLKKACQRVMTVKRLRSQVRQLRSMKLVSVKKAA